MASEIESSRPSVEISIEVTVVILEREELLSGAAHHLYRFSRSVGIKLPGVSQVCPNHVQASGDVIG